MSESASMRERRRTMEKLRRAETSPEEFSQILSRIAPQLQSFAFRVAVLAEQRGLVLPHDRGIRVLGGSVSLDLFWEVFHVMEQSIHGLAIEVFTGLDEKDRRELGLLIVDQLKKSTSLERIKAQGSTAIQALITALVVEEVDTVRPALQHRVKELVAQRLEAEVDALVQKKLAEAVAKVKAEVLR